MVLVWGLVLVLEMVLMPELALVPVCRRRVETGRLRR